VIAAMAVSNIPKIKIMCLDGSPKFLEHAHAMGVQNQAASLQNQTTFLAADNAAGEEDSDVAAADADALSNGGIEASAAATSLSSSPAGGSSSAGPYCISWWRSIIIVNTIYYLPGRISARHICITGGLQHCCQHQRPIRQ
jgi:hypothetical protein